MMYNVLKSTHWMFGIDFHRAGPPFPPICIAVPIPHLVSAASLSEPPLGSASKRRADVLTENGAKTIAVGHDIGMGIDHFVPPHLLSILHTLTSSSKSQFGPSSVVTPAGPVAVAVKGGLNLNQNCCNVPFPPLLSGVIVAGNTHVTDLTPGDLVAGKVRVITTALIEVALGYLFLKGPGGRLSEKLSEGLFGPLFRKLTHEGEKALEKPLEKVAEKALELLGGKVLEPIAEHPLERALEKLYESEEVEEFPSEAPEGEE